MVGMSLTSMLAVLVDARGFSQVTVQFDAQQNQVQYCGQWVSGFNPPHSPLTVFELAPFTAETDPRALVTSLPPSLCSSLCVYPVLLLLHVPPCGSAALAQDVFMRLLQQSTMAANTLLHQSHVMRGSARPSLNALEEVARRVKRGAGAGLPVSGGSAPGTSVSAPLGGVKGARRVRRPKKCKDVSEESEANDVCELGEEDEEDVGEEGVDELGEDGGDGGGDDEEDGEEDEEDDADDADDGEDVAEEEDGVESDLGEDDEEDLGEESGLEDEECEAKAPKKARVGNV